MLPDGPALGLLELCSIARGILVADAMVKKAPVKLAQAGSTHPGKYTILLRGGVDEVYEAMQIGQVIAAEQIIDELLLPNPHPQLNQLIDGPVAAPLSAVAILEGFSVAGTLRGADAALKAAEVEGIHLTLARDLGGKGLFIFTGELHDIEAAVEAGRAALGEGLLAGCEIIANPHPDLITALG